ncbi:MAG TPA: type VI secretion system tip protein TssI/VgrG [Polyangiaceae bacterium]|nr:type VI secretion system tip protein TssI/VgrG [Polyangiaceae bacterium]
MSILDLWFASGESTLAVRSFKTVERMFDLFEVTVVALSPNEDVDLDAIVGKPAAFYMAAGALHLARDGRRFAGICSHMEQLKPEVKGVSTYQLRIVPALWQLTQRRNHRTFQHMSVPEIADQLLDEWRIERAWAVDRSQHPRLELRVQYGETDYDFLRRMLEEAGIAFYFRDGEDDKGATLVLQERPDRSEPRGGEPIHYVDNPNEAAEREFVTEVRVTQEVRTGRVTIRDHDFRRSPEYKLQGQSSAPAPEHLLEQHTYAPGAFLVEGGKPGGTPVADDKGVARHDDQAGQGLAERRLEGLRASRRLVSFRTNAPDLHPGVVFAISGHPRAELAPEHPLLALELSMEGTSTGAWTYEGRAGFSEVPYRPPQATPKPQIHGVESAIVVGPRGEEIHTDEFARVRVQFHWDRYADFSDKSSCWVRVSQGWAGSAFGMIAIPRVGQEVLVAFLGGNPDHPVVVGRLYNSTSPVPYKLPENKTVSGWKSDSTPGSNGYNEIRFDDARGRELVAIQAERNLEKVVKIDEKELTGKTRLIEVGERLELTTGKATIILDGENITIEAAGEIVFKGDKRIVSHGGPLTEFNPWIPKNKRGKVTPPPKFPPVPKVPGEIAVEPYAVGIAMRGYPEFRERMRAALDRLKATRTGRAVMKKIARSGQGVILVETKTKNTLVYPVDPAKATWEAPGVAGEGSSSIVAHNPSFKPNGEPSEVALGHALVTAWHNAIGEREQGSTDGVPNQYLKSKGSAPYSRLRPSEARLRKNLNLPIDT